MPRAIQQLYTFLFLLLASSTVMASIGPKVGQQAPGFELKDLKGKTHSLKDLRKKGHVLLVFWSTRCHVCHALIPKFKEIHKKYNNKGLVFAAINVGFENSDEVEDYVFEFKLDYLVLNEDEKKTKLAEEYQLVGTPTFELIAPDGTVKYRGYSVPDLDKLMKTSTAGK